MRIGKLWLPNLIVFMSSACVMIIELVAGRMIAPYLGVSLYTWTSVIGIILAGISLGNYLGGVIADRYAAQRTLGIVLLVAGLASLSILATNELVGELTGARSFPLPLRILAFTALVFFIPSCVLGTVSPLVVKLSLKDLGRTGNVVGKIYAYSALGSILGTFATGFFLISWFGTRTIVWVVACILMLMGIVSGDLWRRKGRLITILALVIFLGGLVVLGRKGLLASPCTRETNYYCIKVSEETLEDHSVVYALTLDRMVHSYTSLDEPRKLVYDYEKVYAKFTDQIAKDRPFLRTLFIGGGGYTFPKYMEALYPQSSIEVIEIDPGVTQVAQDLLGLDPEAKIITYNEDARIFFNELEGDPEHDLIIGDAFNDFSVPYHLTTREFNERVKRCLKDDGFYMVNILDGHRALFLRAYLNTLKVTFPHVYLIPTIEAWREVVRTSFVIVASSERFDLDEMAGDEMIGRALAGMELDEFLEEGRRVVLTDDYVPVDNLLAPVFRESG